MYIFYTRGGGGVHEAFTRIEPINLLQIFFYLILQIYINNNFLIAKKQEISQMSAIFYKNVYSELGIFIYSFKSNFVQNSTLYTEYINSMKTEC